MPDLEDMIHDAMMDVKDEAEYERWYDEIVEDFKADNLATYYNENPELLMKSFDILDEAQKVLDISPSATLLFAFTAIETAIKNTLIQPIIFGITHNEKVAILISNNFLQIHSADRYINMAFYLTKEAINLNLSDMCKPLVSKIQSIAKKRNKIIHSAELCTKEEAEFALIIANNVLEEIIKPTLSQLYFKIHNKEICRILGSEFNY